MMCRFGKSTPAARPSGTHAAARFQCLASPPSRLPPLTSESRRTSLRVTGTLTAGGDLVDVVVGRGEIPAGRYVAVDHTEVPGILSDPGHPLRSGHGERHAAEPQGCVAPWCPAGSSLCPVGMVDLDPLQDRLPEPPVQAVLRRRFTMSRRGRLLDLRSRGFRSIGAARAGPGCGPASDYGAMVVGGWSSSICAVSLAYVHGVGSSSDVDSAAAPS